MTTWIITSDLLEDGELIGMSSVNYKEDTKLVHKFRLLDGDGRAYYSGLSDDSSSFAPLDDFGRGYAGCVSIEYLEGDVWKPL